MILILSNALTKRWKLKPIPLERAFAESSFTHPAFIWRVDWFRVGPSRSNILCINEASAYSFVLLDQKKMEFKSTILNIINRIGDSLQHAGMGEKHIRCGITEVFFVKKNNPKINGAMTDQKLQYEWGILEPAPGVRTIDDVERRVNHCPSGILDMAFPSEVFAKIAKQNWPTTAFKLPDPQDWFGGMNN